MQDDRNRDIDTLARTLWGEARGEDHAGRVAVANVIMNRVRHAARHRERRGTEYWWGGTPAEVCRKPWQFSCWNDNDPNRAKLLAVDAEDPTFRECLEIARAAVDGSLEDTTHGADHYVNPRVAAPPWAEGVEPVARVGAHEFYRLYAQAPQEDC